MLRKKPPTPNQSQESKIPEELSQVIRAAVRDTLGALVAVKGICKAAGLKPTAENIALVYEIYMSTLRQYVVGSGLAAVTDEPLGGGGAGDESSDGWDVTDA